MRAPSVLIVVALGLVVGARAATAAPPPLVVFHAGHGGGEMPASVIAARDALAARARQGGLAWIDLTPAAAPAPVAPEARRQAIEAYESLRFDDAVTLLDRAVAEAYATGAAGLDGAALSDLFLYRGLCRTQLGDAAQAWDDLVRAATLAPARVLDPLRFPSRAVEAFARARVAVAAQPMVELAVAAPADCAVFVDGERSAAPATRLPAGEHLVRVECPGRVALATRVVLVEAPVRLPAAPAAVRVPDDDELRELGRARGATEIVIVTVAASPGAPPTLHLRRVEVAGAGKERAAASVALAPGGAATPDAVAAFERVLASPDVGAGPVRPAPKRSAWRTVAWVAVGAAVATAVLLPFALSDGGGGTGATLAPSGFSAW